MKENRKKLKKLNMNMKGAENKEYEINQRNLKEIKKERIGKNE